MIKVKQFNAYDFLGLDVNVDHGNSIYEEAFTSKFDEISQMDPRTIEGAEALKRYSLAFELLGRYIDSEYRQIIQSNSVGNLEEYIEARFGHNLMDSWNCDLLESMLVNIGELNERMLCESSHTRAYYLSYAPNQFLSVEMDVMKMVQAVVGPFDFKGKDGAEEGLFQNRVVLHVREVLQNRAEEVDSRALYDVPEYFELYGSFTNGSNMPLLEEFLKSNIEIVAERFAGIMSRGSWVTEEKYNTYGSLPRHDIEGENRKANAYAKIALKALSQDHGLYRQNDRFVHKMLNMSLAHLDQSNCRKLFQDFLVEGYENEQKLLLAFDSSVGDDVSTKEDFSNAVLAKLRPVKAMSQIVRGVKHVLTR